MSIAVAPDTITIPATAIKVFSGVFFDVYQWQQELYDGSFITFERAKRPDSASVIAVTPDKKIIVTQQEQPTLKPFWGLLGGVVDPGETPLETAQRELLEESGMEATSFEHWFSVQNSSRVEWAIHMYIAHDAQLVQAAAPEAGEKITLHTLEFEEFVQLVQHDKFRNHEVSLRVLQAAATPNGLNELKKLFFQN